MHDSPFKFEQILRPYLAGAGPVAIGVSGGPDSMALCHALAHNGLDNGFERKVHALCVDHGLRPESHSEAEQVGRWIKGWPGLEHYILKRDLPVRPGTKIQEEARRDRYKLMAEHCAVHNIEHLFIAHHQNDQAETFLFRLAKGSGLDGLGGMRTVYNYNEQLKIIRPLLERPKAELMAYCQENDISFIDDLSNEDSRFARARLRQSCEILAKEGLTPKRLTATAARLSRAKDALDFYTEKTWDRVLLEQNPHRIVFRLPELEKVPMEIKIRVLLRATNIIGKKTEYGPRMEKVENLAQRIFRDTNFKRCSLGGCLFGRDDTTGWLIVEKES